MHIFSNGVFLISFHLFLEQGIVSTQWIVQICNAESGSVFIVNKARFSFVQNVTRIYVVPVEGNIYTSCPQHNIKLWLTE